jgi:soluble lytic murein transglycosylase-like protein
LILDHVVETVSGRYGVDKYLVHAVIRQESAYDVYAVSHKGAQGLMQLMPATQRELGVRNPFDPWQNVDGGVRYLLEQLIAFRSLDRALGAYHAGPAREARGKRPQITWRYISAVKADYANLSASKRQKPVNARRPMVRRQDAQSDFIRYHAETIGRFKQNK